MTDRPLLTARAVAELLDVTPETVLRWVRRGELPAVRLPGTVRGRLRFRVEDVDAWIEARAMGAAPREGDSHPDGRAQTGGYAPVPSLVTAIPPRPGRGDNRGGS